MSSIKIKEKTINGINNPELSAKLYIKEKDFKIKVEADGKEIDHEFFPEGDRTSYILRSTLPPTSKNIVIKVTTKDETVKSKLVNKKINRIFRKIFYIVSKIFRKIKLFFYVIYKGIKFLWREHHFLIPPVMWKKYFKDFKDRMKGGNTKFYNPFHKTEYNKWLNENKEEIEYKKLKYKPLISILIPVYNINEKYLSECLDSILNQKYENFEVCLVDDCSTLEETKNTLEKYKKLDKRIKVKYRKENGHISKTTNDALEMAKGEFISLVDDDDLLTENALYEVVKVLNDNKELDFIYSDEDKMSPNGTLCDPHFKPDWSPDTLLSLNYICHLTTIRKSLVEKVGGFTVGLEGAQDHDLFLKVTEKTDRIYHIPKVLYHWRMVEGSTSMTISNKSYATDKGKMAIENALKRRKIDAEVEKDEKSTYYIVHYKLKKEPLVSIIIPTRDYADITRTCIESIYEKTTYKNFEIILANNDSQKEETFELFKELKKKHKNFKVVDINIEFNYSRINNLAVKEAKGEYIVLLNNDTEIISPNWLTEMIGYASQKHVGVVGPKLLYEDMTVQHAGVLLGLGGVASHAYIGSSRDDMGAYGRLRVPYNYAANTAACLAIKRSIYEEVGGLEEDLKVAYNDIDFNIKVLSKGYYNVFIPHVELIHYESKSRGLDTTSDKYKRFLEESNYMYKKWDNIINNDPFYNPNYSKNAWFKLKK